MVERIIKEIYLLWENIFQRTVDIYLIKGIDRQLKKAYLCAAIFCWKCVLPKIAYSCKYWIIAAVLLYKYHNYVPSPSLLITILPFPFLP